MAHLRAYLNFIEVILLLSFVDRGWEKETRSPERDMTTDRSEVLRDDSVPNQYMDGQHQWRPLVEAFQLNLDQSKLQSRSGGRRLPSLSWSMCL